MTTMTKAESKENGESSESLRVTAEITVSVSEEVSNGSAQVEQEEEETSINAMKAWSKVLNSPPGIACFSPSVGDWGPLNKSGSFHGLGMQLAIEKSKSVGLVSHRLLLLMTDIVDLYETFGLVGLRNSKLVNRIPFPTHLEKQSKSFIEILESFFVHTRKLVEFYRSQIIVPLQESFPTNGVIVTNAKQRYLQSRQRSKEARKNALVSRRRYVKAVKTAELSFDNWKKARTTSTLISTNDIISESSSSIDPWELTLTRLGASVPEATVQLIQQLKVVQVYKEDYEDNVSKENLCVDEAQESEEIGLLEIQSLVEGRLQFFLDPFATTIYNVSQGSIEHVTTTPPEQSIGNGIGKKGKSLFSNLFQQKIVHYEDGTAMMEAETFGLPKEIGWLRERMQITLSKYEVQIETFQSLRNFLNEFILKVQQLSLSLKAQIQSGKRTGEKIESVQTLALKNLGKNSFQLFEDTLKHFIEEAKLMSDVAESLLASMKEKLDPFLERAVQELQAAVASDNARWKQLVDASRFESKVEGYKLQNNNSRARVSSLDVFKTGETGEEDSPLRKVRSLDNEDEISSIDTPTRVQKAFGTIFAKMASNEAGQKVSKLQAIESYETITEAKVQSFETLETKGWNDMKEVLESVVEDIMRISTVREEDSAEKVTFDLLNKDIDEWKESSMKQIRENMQEKVVDVPEYESGFSLAVVLVESRCIDILLTLTGNEASIPELHVKPSEITTVDLKEPINGVNEEGQKHMLSPVTPDSILKGMEIVLSKSIPTTIASIYENVWSEGKESADAPFYWSWLKKEGCFEVDVGDWETDGTEGFVNSWCKERYSQRRLVTFKFKRTSHLYIGPPIAFVKQEQFLRVSPNKCVVAMCVTFDGLPYADTFAVQVRWVATRKGEEDVSIQVGLFVDFKKATVLKSQIRNGCLSETKNVHNRLFEAVAVACAVPAGELLERKDEEVKDDISGKLMSLLSTIPLGKEIFIYAVFYSLMMLSSFLFGGKSSDAAEIKLLTSKVDALQEEVKSLQESIMVLTSLVQGKQTTESSGWF